MNHLFSFLRRVSKSGSEKCVLWSDICKESAGLVGTGDRLQRVREENLDNERRAMSKWISEDGLTESVDEPEEVLSSGV